MSLARAANAGLDFRIFPHLRKVFSRDAGGLAELYNRSQNLTIFDFKKCRDLEMGSKVTHRLTVIENGIIR